MVKWTNSVSALKRLGLSLAIGGLCFAYGAVAQQGDFLEVMLPEDSGDVGQMPTGNEPFEISTGDFGLSIMYSETDIRNMMQILEVFERTGMTPTELVESGMVEEDDLIADLLATPEDQQPVQKVAPRPLPNFYLGTIMYHNANNWSIWVNKKRINSVKPEFDFGEDGSLKVSAITRQLVTLSWKPNDVKTALRVWKDREKLRPAGMKHRKAMRVQVDYNPDNHTFVATMRTNQTFVGNSMEILEGRAKEPSALELDPEPVANSNQGTTDGAGVGAGAAQYDGPALNYVRDPALMTPERRAAERVIQESKKLQKVAPKARNQGDLLEAAEDANGDPFVEDN